MRILRSMLFTPGNNWRMIQKAKNIPADAIILDLEDAVPMEEKETARIFIEDGIQQIKSGGKQVYVRVNSLSTGLTQEDLEYAVQESLDGIVLAKAESNEDVVTVDEMIAKLVEEKGLQQNHIAIIPLLETAKGVLNADEIMRASDRIVAICFGALDFTRDMGTTLSKEGIEILYARSRIALIANAHKVQAIDTPWFDVINEEGLIREIQLAKQLGFRGKLLIHPDHLEPVNRLFSPTEEEIHYALKVVKVFKEAEVKGLGAVSLDGKMIDTATYKQAEALLKYTDELRERAMNLTALSTHA